MSTLPNYLFTPSDIISLVRAIHESGDMSRFMGNVSLTRENSGPSGAKFRSLITELNNKLKGEYSYLEIGIYRGRTIITSAVDNPATTHIGVDNFSQFDPERKNADRIYKAIDDLKLSNVKIVEDDFMQYFKKLGRKPQRNIGVYFYDAIHDYRSQLIGLMQGARVMVPGGVMLVDDTNYAHVRYSVYDFIEANPDFKLLFETFTHMHPSKMNPEESKSAKDGWWNGTQLIMYDPDNRAKGLGATRDDDTDLKFAKAVTQTPADCPGLPTLFAGQD